MSLLLKPMVIDDFDEVIALWKSSEGIGLSTADSRESIESYLRRNPGLSFVVRNEEELLGAVLCGHDGRRGFIHHLAVHTRYQRRGIGSRLVEACLDQLKIQGVQKCHLFVFTDNKKAVSFWDKLGWQDRVELTPMSRQI